MNKILKFRIWVKDEKKMYYHGVGIRNSGTGTIIFIDGIERLLDNNIEIMQYTGLKDKNGLEIYEEDIIDKFFTPPITKRSLWIKGVIKFGTHSGYYQEWKNDAWSDLRDTEVIKVIGNIYENPELLKK